MKLQALLRRERAYGLAREIVDPRAGQITILREHQHTTDALATGPQHRRLIRYGVAHAVRNWRRGNVQVDRRAPAPAVSDDQGFIDLTKENVPSVEIGVAEQGLR